MAYVNTCQSPMLRTLKALRYLPNLLLVAAMESRAYHRPHLQRANLEFLREVEYIVHCQSGNEQQKWDLNLALPDPSPQEQFLLRSASLCENLLVSKNTLYPASWRCYSLQSNSSAFEAFDSLFTYPGRCLWPCAQAS